MPRSVVCCLELSWIPPPWCLLSRPRPPRDYPTRDELGSPWLVHPLCAVVPPVFPPVPLGSSFEARVLPGRRLTIREHQTLSQYSASPRRPRSCDAGFNQLG